MKPIKISFGCFGAFPGEESIDLTDVGREGLFLVCGDTGAGKTTLLDAMCYALYYTSSGGSSGDPGKGTFESMRSRFVDETDKRPTYVELELEKNGETYRFRRELKPHKRAAGFDEVHTAFRLTENGPVPLVNNPTQKSVTAEAEKLTGLKADQFRQIIILPQGKFEQLLTSGSEAKETILSTLFGVDMWQKAVERLKTLVKDEKDGLKEERSLLSGRLAGKGCETSADLADSIALRRENLPILEQARKEADSAFDKANNAVNAASADDQLFRDLEKRQNIVIELEKELPLQRQKQERLASAAAAEKLRSVYETAKRLQKEESAAVAVADAAQKDYKDAQSTAEKAKAEWDVHESKRADYNASQEALIRREAAKQDYRDYDCFTAEAEALAKEFAAAEKKNTDAARVKAEADKAFVAAEDLYGRKRKQCDEIRRGYTLSAAGRLAEALEQDKPCPVCGSVHHPFPAGKTAEHVTDEMLREAEEAEKKQEKQWRDADAASKKAAEDAGAADKALTEVRGRLTANEKQCAAAKGKLIENIGTLAELEKSITAYQKARGRYEQAEETLKKALTEAQKKETTCEERRRAAAEEKNKKAEASKAASLELAEKLVSEGFADETALAAAFLSSEAAERLRKEISDFDGNLAHARQEYESRKQAVQGRTRPDMAALNRAREQAKTAASDAAANVKTAQTELEERTKLLSEVQSKEKDLDKRTADWERRQQFAEKLDYRGMNLHRYVLAAMLGSVIEQANALLTNVHGGRYELRRSEEATAGKQKAGLEFNVLDRGNNSERSVKSLSGGEKFLVSLALAIGLNTVMQMQSGGVRVEALFVDEGFGTLDNDSVADAMQMLNRVRAGKGMVGIISHVDLLRSEISSHIEIHKDANHGSRIEKNS